MTGQTSRVPTLRWDGNPVGSAGRDFGLGRAVTVVGRDPGCDIVLAPTDVSRRHARIVRQGEACFLEDLGSTGGTFLNGAPVSGRVHLNDGDVIAIGGCRLIFGLGIPRTAVSAHGSESTAILGVREISGTEERELAGFRSEEKLRALLEIGRDLVGKPDLREVLSRILDALFRVFPKADRGFVLLKKEGSGGLVPRAIKVRGGTAGRLTISRTIFEHVILHGQAVLSEDVSTDDRFGGSLSVDEAELRTLMCVPLKDHQGTPVGILQLDTRDQRSRFTRDDLDILVAVAGQASAAIEHARLLEVAGQERSRLAFLAEAGSVLASSLDLPATLTAVARLSVPRLGDLCVIDLCDEDGTIRGVAAAHADPAKQALVDALRQRDAPVPDGPHPALRVLRTGRSELANAIPDAFLESVARDPEHLALLRQLGLSSYIVVPLVARGRTLGVISLIGTESGRQYGAADLALAEELARRAAQSIDNAALYQEAQEARKRAEEAGRSKDLFLAMLSHELRTPLTPILAVVSANLERQTDPALRDEWEMIRRNVVLEARLIDDLLDLSRIERGQLRLDLAVVDVHGILRQAIEICRDEVFVAGLDVVLEPAAADHHVEADEARLLQIAWNLIRNAAKFTPSGGSLTIRTRNEPTGPSTASPALIVEFEDSGQGIEPEVIGRIFDAFEQGEADLRGRSGGLGLGLAISRTLAETHGGSLTARSPGRGLGSTFRLELGTVAAPALEPEVPPSTRPSAPTRSLRILLVEDNHDTLRFLALILGQRGNEIRTAASLAEARKAADAAPLDLVISDIELPDGTGLELMRDLADRGVPGIAMSGFGSDDDIRLSKEAGFAEHLTKPVDLGRLERTIQQVAQLVS